MRQDLVAGHADLAHEVHRRDALLASRNQENSLEPGRERKLRVLELRSGGDGRLSPAPGELPQVPVLEPAVHRAAAGRHLNPEGHRSFASASAHFSSVPKSFRNIVMLIPFRNRTRFLFAMGSPGVLVPHSCLYS